MGREEVMRWAFRNVTDGYKVSRRGRTLYIDDGEIKLGVSDFRKFIVAVLG